MDFSSVSRALDSFRRRKPLFCDELIQRSFDLGKSDDSRCLLDTLDFFVNTDHVRCEGKDSNEDDAITVAGIITQSGIRWEPLAVGIFVGTELLLNYQHQFSTTMTNDKNKENSVYIDGPRVPSMAPSLNVSCIHMPLLSNDQVLQLTKILHDVSMKHLEHPEPRVRTLVAKAIGAYCRFRFDDAENKERISEMQRRLTQSIHEHIVSGRDDRGKYSKSSEGALDDTTGWRALETNWLALASLISSLSGNYLAEFGINSQILQDSEFSSINHVNRHVRAASMACMEQMIRAVDETRSMNLDGSQLVSDLLLDPSSCVSLRTSTVAILRAGLADNWSQVRMASSVLCRVMLMTLDKLGSPVDDIYPILLPRMCLNRFYLAQGVKLYSHETWKLVFKSSALPHIVQHLPAVCRYYIKMADADNHAVREAACQAIAEVAVRLSENDSYKPMLRDQIDALLQALLMCFHDESWPVRDEACLACGIICKAYPEECRAELKTLWDRWTEQLTDPIWSVREDAAVALGCALEAYGVEFLDKIKDLMRKLLPSAKDQPVMSREEYKAHVNNIKAHTDSTLYSCGSLAPKLKKGGAGRIGCTNCGIDRPKAPWEATDGCLYLIREIFRICSPPVDGSQPFREDILMRDDELIQLCNEIVNVCRLQHFPQSDELRTTLWRCLPSMAFCIGKDRFKRHYLEIFIDLIFANLESRTASQLSLHAAGQCAEELSNLVGITIFRGRLEDDQRVVFDKTMRERQMMPKGPSMGDSFSPFGPTGSIIDSTVV
jgi:HEAT repeat